MVPLALLEEGKGLWRRLVEILKRIEGRNGLEELCSDGSVKGLIDVRLWVRTVVGFHALQSFLIWDLITGYSLYHSCGFGLLGVLFV